MSGLDALKGQAARNRGGGRTLPPPRNKPRETPVELPADTVTAPAQPTAVPPAEPSGVVAAPAPAQPLAVRQQQKPAERRPPTTNADESTTGVARATIYFDDETDQWLEQVIALGRRGSPKVSSKSAVARFAIKELARRMTPEAVIADMRQTAVNSPNQTGRPRL